MESVVFSMLSPHVTMSEVLVRLLVCTLSSDIYEEFSPSPVLLKSKKVKGSLVLFQASLDIGVNVTGSFSSETVH